MANCTSKHLTGLVELEHAKPGERQICKITGCTNLGNIPMLTCHKAQAEAMFLENTL